MIFWDELELWRHLLALLLGTPRLLMIWQVSPFLGGGVVTGNLRFTLTLACYLVLHPAIAYSLPPLEGGGMELLALWGALVLKEVFLGLLLGLLAGIIFWSIQCAGLLIDTQRGASNAEAPDILTGETLSPTAAFLFQSAVYLFFAGGGFVAFLGVIYAGYMVWPVTELLPLNVLQRVELPLFFAAQVQWLMLHTLLLAGPVMAACLLTDVSLGLVSRTAPQLNVYVLSMPIKSAVASFLLLLYFGLLTSGALGMLYDSTLNLRQFESILPAAGH